MKSILGLFAVSLAAFTTGQVQDLSLNYQDIKPVRIAHPEMGNSQPSRHPAMARTFHGPESAFAPMEAAFREPHSFVDDMLDTHSVHDTFLTDSTFRDADDDIEIIDHDPDIYPWHTASRDSEDFFYNPGLIRHSRPDRYDRPSGPFYPDFGSHFHHNQPGFGFQTRKSGPQNPLPDAPFYTNQAPTDLFVNAHSSLHQPKPSVGAPAQTAYRPNNDYFNAGKAKFSNLYSPGKVTTRKPSKKAQKPLKAPKPKKSSKPIGPGKTFFENATHIITSEVVSIHVGADPADPKKGKNTEAPKQKPPKPGPWKPNWSHKANKFVMDNAKDGIEDEPVEHNAGRIHHRRPDKFQPPRPDQELHNGAYPKRIGHRRPDEFDKPPGGAALDHKTVNSSPPSKFAFEKPAQTTEYIQETPSGAHFSKDSGLYSAINKNIKPPRGYRGHHNKEKVKFAPQLSYQRPENLFKPESPHQVVPEALHKPERPNANPHHEENIQTFYLPISDNPTNKEPDANLPIVELKPNDNQLYPHFPIQSPAEKPEKAPVTSSKPVFLLSAVDGGEKQQPQQPSPYEGIKYSLHGPEQTHSSVDISHELFENAANLPGLATTAAPGSPVGENEQRQPLLEGDQSFKQPVDKVPSGKLPLHGQAFFLPHGEGAAAANAARFPYPPITIIRPDEVQQQQQQFGGFSLAQAEEQGKLHPPQLSSTSIESSAQPEAISYENLPGNKPVVQEIGNPRSPPPQEFTFHVAEGAGDRGSNPGLAYQGFSSPAHQPQNPHRYIYSYHVNEHDNHGNPNIHSKTERRDGGKVQGQYKVQLPDCRTQIVDYHVNELRQYFANVQYQGEPCQSQSQNNYQSNQQINQLVPPVGHPQHVNVMQLLSAFGKFN